MLIRLLSLIVLLAWNTVVGQTLPGINVAGSLIDSVTAKPIALATVSLFERSKKVAATTTDSTGNFLMNDIGPGSYTLELSYVGYRLKTFPLKISPDKKILNIGAINLVSINQQLKTVTVTGQNALIEDKGDRLVYNAEKDISNAGGTAADVLRKVPTLTVDLNGNVQMRGNSNIKVLINGKPSTMMARNLADALRQMPAQVIKSVEVITSPGAKYDAEGAAGVINIITKKGYDGFNGSVSTTVGNLNHGLGTTLNLKKKKIGFSLSANGYSNRNIRDNREVRTTLVNSVPINILQQNSTADNNRAGGYGEMGFDYDPDTSNHINFAANVWGSNAPYNNTQYIRLTDIQGRELQAFRNESHFKNPFGNGQLDLGYTKTFKKADQEFSFLTQFSRMPDNYFYNTERYMQDVLFFKDKSTNYSRNKEYTLQADYVHPISIRRIKDTTDIKIELGVKAIIRDIGSEFHVEQSLDGHSEMLPDPLQSNDLKYTQKVYSGYTSLRLNNKHKWGLNAGARLEHTEISGNFFSTGTRLDNQYNNLIPSVTISKGIQSHTLKISYTQRITRPLIWYLNPWINKSDPKNIQTGTPTLQPELNHAVELAHSISNKKGLSVNSALYMRITNNALEYLSTVDSAGTSLSKPENIAQRKALGVNINVSSKPNKNWTLNGGGDLRYVDLRSKALQQHNSGLSWNMNVNSTYTLPNNYSVETSGGVGSGWISLQQTTRSLYYWYGFSGKRQFWNKKASLTFNFNNPFNRGVWQKSIQQAPTFTAENRYFYVGRSARLTFEWRFGQINSNGVKQGKKIKNDDSGR